MKKVLITVYLFLSTIIAFSRQDKAIVNKVVDKVISTSDLSKKGVSDKRVFRLGS